MKSLSILAAALALAGCASIDQMSYGSWLDHVGQRKAARYPLSADERQALQGRAAQLQANADAVRLKLAAEKDRVQRIAYLRQLEDIGDDLRPIERTLRSGGTNSRRYPAPPLYEQAGGL
jgi:hypothetical protein